MNYEVSEKKGETLRIGLRETGEGQYEVTLGDETVHLDAVRSGPTIYSIIEDGQQFEAMVDERGAHGFEVLVGGRLFHFESLDERTKLLASSALAVTSGPQTVEAEMPGKVVRVNLAPTNAVKAVHSSKRKTKLLCGAGIVSGEDVGKAIQLGSKGILVASGIVKARNWNKIIEEFTKQML